MLSRDVSPKSRLVWSDGDSATNQVSENPTSREHPCIDDEKGVCRYLLLPLHSK